MRGFNHRKSVQALNYLAGKAGGQMNKMKAIKLIWLSDRLHLRKYGRTITGDVYFAMPLGPVPSTTRDILEHNKYSLSDDELNYTSEFLTVVSDYEYASTKEPNLKVFSKTDIEAIDEVFNVYGHMEPFSLSNVSHAFPEWKRYESALKQKLASRFEMDVLDFFEKSDDVIGPFNESVESLALAKEVYIENKNLLSALQ